MLFLIFSWAAQGVGGGADTLGPWVGPQGARGCRAAAPWVGLPEGCPRGCPAL